MTDRDRLWRCIREAAALYDPPDHLTEGKLRGIAIALTQGLAFYSEDQAVLGPVPEWAVDEEARP